jgi:N-formylglutamate deformylase
MEIYDFHAGPLPLLISIPHAGREVPHSMAEHFTNPALGLPDTDWHVEKLYAFARDLGACVIKANFSRYVVDLNRAPDSAALYAASPTTPVCPTASFAGSALYTAGREPDAAAIASRIEQFWQPYHTRIAQELGRLRARHGAVLLWDAHSIASEIPSLFAGVLPEFNFGTREGSSCPRAIADELAGIVTQDGRFTAVRDGRFKGGYITLHYGRPAEGVYAIQLELAQRAYMDESAPETWNPQRAEAAAKLIERVLMRYLELRPTGTAAR